MLKADESHLDWLAKKKASLATISKSKKNHPRVLEAENEILSIKTCRIRVEYT